MHDIFKDAIDGIVAYNRVLAEPKTADPRHIEAMLSELHLIRLERLRLQSRITELEAVLQRIDQRMMGKTP